MTECFCGCHQRAEPYPHHLITRQELRKYPDVDPDDPRNLVPVAMSCHRRHHDRFRPFSVHSLPTPVFDFAVEAMGAGAAYEFINRTYDGTDLRLERLLGEPAF